MFSRTVISRNRLWFCGTWTTPALRISRGVFPVSRSPSSVTSPSPGRRRRRLSEGGGLPSRPPRPPPPGVPPPATPPPPPPQNPPPPPYPTTSPRPPSARGPASGAAIVFLRRSEVGVKHAVIVA